MLTLAIDLDNDGLYTATNEDLTDYLLCAEWQTGRAHPTDIIPTDSTAEFQLNNATRLFSPEYATSPYAENMVGKRVRLGLTIGASNYLLWQGWVVAIEVMPAQNGERHAILYCEQGIQRLKHTPVQMPIQQNQTADAILSEVFSQVVASPNLAEGWLLGITTRSELNTHTTLYDPADQFSSETGKSIFAYYGDTWNATTTLYEAIEPLIEAEHGVFWQDRAGIFQFRNRHHWISSTTVADTLTVDADTVTAEYAYSKELVNAVRVTAYPRQANATDSVIWQASTALLVNAYTTRTITIRLHDTDGASVGVLSYIRPEPYTDYTAIDANGFDVTSTITPLVDLEGRTATVSFINTSAQPVWVTAQLRGYTITRPDALSVDLTEPISLATYGRKWTQFNLVALNNPEEAENFGRWYLTQYAEPIGTLSHITLKGRNTSWLNRIADFVFGTRIALSATQPDHQRDYFVVGEQGAWSAMQGIVMRLTLLPADLQPYWVLGRSLIENDSLLAY